MIIWKGKTLIDGLKYFKDIDNNRDSPKKDNSKESRMEETKIMVEKGMQENKKKTKTPEGEL